MTKHSAKRIKKEGQIVGYEYRGFKITVKRSFHTTGRATESKRRYLIEGFKGVHYTLQGAKWSIDRIVDGR